MTTNEQIESWTAILADCNKKAERYNMLANSYLEKFKKHREKCNKIIQEIDNLKNKLSQENKAKTIA